jgi:hypothetical protein
MSLVKYPEKNPQLFRKLTGLSNVEGQIRMSNGPKAVTY